MKKLCAGLILMMLSVALLAGALAAPSSSPGASVAGVAEEPLSPEKQLEILLEEAKRDRLEKMKNERVPKQKNYDNNSVCAFGPQFREITGKLTNEWYMFTPIDLSEDGTQTFELIAGNMYVVGTVSVTVKEGRFQVDYAYNSRHIKAGREYFTLFTDFESITRKDMDNFKKEYSYGKTYSIEDALGGDTDVILFVCNTVTFKKSASGLTRYFSTNPEREQLRDAMLERIGKSYKSN